MSSSYQTHDKPTRLPRIQSGSAYSPSVYKRRKEKLSKYYNPSLTNSKSNSTMNRQMVRPDVQSKLMTILNRFSMRDKLETTSDDYQNRIGWGGKFNYQGDGEADKLLDPDFVDPDFVEQDGEGGEGGDAGAGTTA